ncbi:hypothetical protein [Streptomyces sp. NPDC059909]
MVILDVGGSTAQARPYAAQDNGTTRAFEGAYHVSGGVIREASMERIG